MEMNRAREPGPRKALGRGLAALIPGAEGTTAQSPGLRQVAVERIRPGREQPRKQFDDAALEELAASIREHGVVQPVVVRRRGDGYELVAGERRWRAAQRAGVQELPALVKEYTDSEALQVALIENLQRQDLDPLEEAAAYRRLLADHDLKQDDVAVAVGKSRAAVANSLRLLKLPSELQAMLADGRLTAGHARALMTTGDERAMAQLAKEIVGRRLTVRDAERRARQLRAPKKTAAKSKSKSASERQVEERLQQALGTKVQLQHSRGKGRIEIYFHSLDQLDALLDRIAP